MIYRYLYRGYCQKNDITINECDNIFNASVAYHNSLVFIYFESTSEDVYPDFVTGSLISYPDGKNWERMNEVFHYSKPLSDEHWKRKIKKEPRFYLIYLKPECVSKYIYYHFQYQEEFPGDGDKYGIIFNISNLLIMYLESPTEEETEKIEGMLKTKNSPRHDDWGDLMKTMFKPWPDSDELWIKIN